jgi:hypothetical protein
MNTQPTNQQPTQQTLPNKYQHLNPHDYSDDFYTEMKIWGILSELLPWKRYVKYTGTICETKPLSRLLSPHEVILFEHNLLKVFKINIKLKPEYRIIDIIKVINNQSTNK